MNMHILDHAPFSEGALPPLPDLLPLNHEPADTPVPIPEYPKIEPFPQPFIRPRAVRAGCWLIRISSSTNPLSILDGTLRVEQHENGRTASGDLYTRPLVKICGPALPGQAPKCFLLPGPGPDPAAGIPIFARSRYQYYMRVTQILEGFTFANSFTLGFEMHRFDSATRSWTNEGAYTAAMAWTAAPTSYPSSYLEGDVKNSAGNVTGRLTMGWVSQYLRRAVIEIDHVAASEVPLNNGAGVDWRTIFDQIGWDVNVYESNNAVPETSGESWSDAELHAGMLAWRDSADLDTQWRYHLMCVRRLDSTSRGIMYDAYGGDTNNIPREGAAMSSHWQFTNDPVFPENQNWGLCAGLRFGQSAKAYFRTAVHEIGHAFMMYHPGGSGNFIMQVTPSIAASAVPPVQFPENIVWSFSPEDSRRLRHLPDVVVRPGTVLRFGDVNSAYTNAPISPLDYSVLTEDLRLQVTPLLDAVPIGAPVRVTYVLTNKSDEPVWIPKRFNLKMGNVNGMVIDSSGAVRTFSTVIRYLDVQEPVALEPRKSITDSLTLLRGPEGALFPSAGMYRVVVTLTWDIDGYPVQLSADASVIVTPPVNEEHAIAALKLINSPDALITLAIGGDHPEGVKAIKVALDNPVLRPHYAFVEAKRLSQSFGKRKANMKAASDLITDDTVMTSAEVTKAAKIVKAEGADSAPAKHIAVTLKKKAVTLDVSDETRNMLDSL